MILRTVNRPHVTTLLFALAISFFFASITALGWFSRWQEQARDAVFRFFGPRRPPSEVVIVAIDDESLRRIGRWPWRRSLHAEIIRRLSRAGARVIGFDLTMSESTPDDLDLARAAKEAGNVFFGMYFSRAQRGVFSSYAPSTKPGSALPSRSAVFTFPEAEGAVYPVTVIRNAAAGTGHANVFPELDGIIRRTPLFIVNEGRIWKSLPLCIAEFVLSRARTTEGKTARIQEWIDLSDLSSFRYNVPFDQNGEILLNFYGEYQAFRYYPAYQVARTLDGESLRKIFRDRIVLIGVTATASADLHATPLLSRCPGVEANCATALANLLHQDFLRPVHVALSFFIVLASGVLSCTLPVRLRMGWSLLVLIALLSAVYSSSLLLFRQFGLWFDFLAPSIAILCTYSCGVLSSLRLQETERIRAQERMASFQRLSEMKSEYVSVVSHELRTPLTAILGYAGTLQRDTQGHFDEKTKLEFYATIYHEAQRLLRLINELLDVARLEAGRSVSVDLKDVDVREALTKAVATQQFYGRRGHIFGLDLPPELPLIKADPDRMEQILLNLLSNAVKYSPDGGTITLSASMDHDEVIIRVQDEGIGISAEQTHQLFQPYQRLGGAQTAKISGTGLGLYLTKALVEAQRGVIWAESEGEGNGATFSFTVPVSEKK